MPNSTGGVARRAERVMMSETAPPIDRPPLAVGRQRPHHHLAAALDRPMTALAFVWLGLLILDLTRGLTGWLAALTGLVRGLFTAHFAVEFLVAPEKGRYLRRNWLAAVARLLPALRLLRIFRAFWVLRAARSGQSFGWPSRGGSCPIAQQAEDFLSDRRVASSE